MKHKALFLDRDGVINENTEEGKYVAFKDEFKLRRGIGEFISRARSMGYRVVVVTNQRGVSCGLYTYAEMDALHEHMKTELALCGASVDAVYACTHGFEDACACRKPKPGMLVAAAEDLGIDLSRSVMVGDRETDVEAGRAAGCATHHLTI